MSLSNEQLWERFHRLYFEFPSIGLATDLSRTLLKEDFYDSMKGPLQKAFAAMDELEGGAMANPDEKRMVGHYWLRNAGLALTPEIRRDIEETFSVVKMFAHEVHSGAIEGQNGPF